MSWHPPPEGPRKLDEWWGPGGHFLVEEEHGLRLLLSGDGTVQGSVDMEEPWRPQLAYQQVLAATLAFVAPERILVVGLGAGTLPRLFRVLCPRAHIAVVEVDEGVRQRARRHFGFTEDPRLSVRVQDAAAFLAAEPGRWDLVLLDAYAGGAIPEHLATRAWFELVKSRLSERGVVASNVFKEAVEPFTRLHREVFSEPWLLTCPPDTNRIIVARASAAPMSRQTLLSRLAALDASGKVPSLAYEALGSLSPSGPAQSTTSGG